MQPHSEGNLVGLVVLESSHHLLRVTVHHGSDLAVLLVLVTSQTFIPDVLHFRLHVVRGLELFNPRRGCKLELARRLAILAPLDCDSHCLHVVMPGTTPPLALRGLLL